MNHDTTSKMDLLKSKCDAVIGSMRIKTPLAYKGYTAYASFNPPPSDMDSTNENAFTYDEQYWVPLSSTAKLDRQSIMTKHHFVAEPEWLPPVQTVQHRVPRPHSRGVKLRSVEAIVNDTQRQKAALSNEERGQLPAVKMPPRQQLPQRQPPQPKSKVLDILDEIKAVSRNSSSNSSTPTKFGLTPTSTTPSSHQNGNVKKQSHQQQSSVPSKRPSDVPNRQSLKKRTQPTTPLATASTPTTSSTPRSAPPRPLATEKSSSKTSDVVTKSRPKSSDTNLDLFLTKQFLINDLNDPAATRHLEDLSSLNVIRKRPILRVHIKVKLPKVRSEARSKEVTMKPKNDTQASPVVNGDASTFNLPTGTIPTEFIRSMKIRKKSKSDQAAAPVPSSPVTAPSASTASTNKSGRSHMVELEEGETISPSPSPRRPHSLSPERNISKSTHKRQRDNSGLGDHEQSKQQSRRSKTSRKEVSLPLSSSSSASSSTSTTSRHITAHDNGDDRQHHGSPSTTSSKSLARKDRYSTNEDDRRPTSSSSKRLERTISAGDDSSSTDRRRSRYSSSSRHSRDEESSRHRSSQRSSGSRQRRSSRSISRSRSPSRRSSSSSSSRNRSSSHDKYRRHAPTLSSSSTSTAAAPAAPAPSTTAAGSSSSSVNRERSTPSVLNGPAAVKDTRTRDTVLTPAAAVLSPAIQAIKNESRDSNGTSVATPMGIPSPAIQAIRNEASVSSPGIIRNESSLSATSPATSATGKVYPPATAPDAETPDQFRVFQRMFQKLALAYKRRGDHASTEISGLLDHFQAFLNYVLSFYFQDKLKYERLENSWDTLLPFSGVLLNKLRSHKAKDKRYDTIYGVCLRMQSLVHFYVAHRQEQFAKPKINQLCQDSFEDTKRAPYSKVVQKMVQHNETAYSTLRESDRYMAFDVLQERFPVTFRDVCVNGIVGAGIVLGGEAGVTVGPMFPLVPYARLHHAAIMAKCLLQELVDTEGIDYLTITKTEDFM